MKLNIDSQGKKALSIVGAIVIIAILLLMVGCNYFNEQAGLSNDHPAEELVEEVLDVLIQNETGVDPEIDLTPEFYPVAEE